MPRQTLKLTLEVRSPFVFAALEPSCHGVDKSALRDAGGMPVIPGDHVRGHLRHAACALYGEGAEEVQALFGVSTDDLADVYADTTAQGIGANQPKRGALIVGDFVAKKFRRAEGMDPEAIGGRSMTLAHRVKIDEESGAADDGMLQTIDLALPPGAIALFEGTVTVRPSGPKGTRMPPNPAKAVEDMLKLVSHVGGLKSAGFGEVATAKLEVTKHVTVERLEAALDRVDVDLAFDRPLLVDVERLAANVLVGSEVVPGAALKGTLAEALRDEGLDVAPGTPGGEALSRIRIGHAFPLVDGRLGGRMLPSAIARARSDHVARAKLCFDTSDLDQLCELGTPAFPMDWKDKDFEWSRDALGRPYSGLKRQARGRVGIEPSGVAEDGKLFVTDLVETQDRVWRVTIDRNDADKAVFGRVLSLLQAGVAGVGRTGAIATAKALGAAAPPIRSLAAGRVVLLLETPLVMTEPDDTDPVPDQYVSYFNWLLGRGVASVRSMATRRMAGEFYAHRYAERKGRYIPFEVTEAGSTFELRLDEAAAAKLVGYLATGLPPRHGGALLTDPVTRWRKTPFVPENGYGEISVFDEGLLETAPTGMEEGP